MITMIRKKSFSTTCIEREIIKMIQRSLAMYTQKQMTYIVHICSHRKNYTMSVFRVTVNLPLLTSMMLSVLSMRKILLELFQWMVKDLAPPEMAVRCTVCNPSSRTTRADRAPVFNGRQHIATFLPCHSSPVLAIATAIDTYNHSHLPHLQTTNKHSYSNDPTAKCEQIIILFKDALKYTQRILQT